MTHIGRRKRTKEQIIAGRVSRREKVQFERELRAHMMEGALQEAIDKATPEQLIQLGVDPAEVSETK